MIHVALFGIEAGLSAWLTYLVHSTAWIAGALALCRYHRALSPAARHIVWRAALLGPLGSSAFALGLGHRWQWSLSEARPADEAWAAAAPYVTSLRPLPIDGHVELVRESASQIAPLELEMAAPLPWSALLAGCWAAVAALGVLLIARAAVRHHRTFRHRVPVSEARCLEALERLGRCAGLRGPVRLSHSAAASTPLVLSRREICLPERALELDPSALESVLAHELAHIERRDGFWLYGALLLQTVLWFQPLNRKARAELQECAELAADDRAVELTGDALGLARTLAHVASWGGRGAPLASAPAMARAGSPIVERVARLVDGEARVDGSFGSRTPWFALAALTAIGACSPSVGAPQAPEPRSALPSSPAGGEPRASVVASHPAPLIDDRQLPDPPAPAAEQSRRGVQEQNSGGTAKRAAESGSTDGDAAELAEDGAELQADLAELDADLQKLDVEARGANAGARRQLAQVREQATRAARDAARAARNAARAARPAASDPGRPGARPDFPAKVVRDMVAGVAPRAIEFSQTMARMAQNEWELQERIRLAEEALRTGPGSPQARADLERLRGDLAEASKRREAVQRDFEARMQAWSKDFEQRFEREFAPRFAAWGEDFGRQMAAMAKDFERQFSERGPLSIPEPPMLPGPQTPRPSPPARPAPPASPQVRRPPAPPLPNAPPQSAPSPGASPSPPPGAPSPPGAPPRQR